MSMNNLVGPWSTPVSYTSPPRKGFIGVPRNGNSGAGWGDPLVSESGESLWPGTPGGPNNAAAIVVADRQWKARRNSKLQQFGNISWRGKLKKPGAIDTERYVLSFHGPSSRMFPTTFVYGTEDKHRNIYMEGGLAAIAPGAVLGACLKSISDKMYLYAVCLTPEGEAVLRRQFTGATYSAEEEDLVQLAAWRSDDHPYGWVQIGSVSAGPEYAAPKTPWFFNESGTEAQCMRKCHKSVTINAAPHEQEAYDRFKLSVGDGSATMQAMGNEPPYEFSESGQRTILPQWTSPNDEEGFAHFWDEMIIAVVSECSGRQVVAVDYNGDEEVLVYFVMDTYYTMYHEYMKGMDQDYYPESSWPVDEPPTYRNHWPGDGRYSNPLRLGVDPAVTVGSHKAGIWFGGTAANYLEFTVGSTRYEMNIEVAGTLTETEFLGMDYVSTDHEVFQRYFEVQYVRHLDVRAGGFVAVRLEKFDEYTKQFTVNDTIHEAYDAQFGDRYVTSYLEGAPKHRGFIGTYHPMFNDYPGRTRSQVWDDVEALPHAKWEWSGQTYTGERPKDNDASAIGVAPVNAWFPEQSPLYRNSWYGTKLLFHGLNQETAGFAVREDGTFILSGELPHPDTGEPTAFKVSEPSNLADLHEGTVFYPLGEM